MSAIKLLAETSDTVTLKRADFEALLRAAEEAADMAAVKMHRAYERRVGWDAARRNYLTGEETRRLLKGEGAVKVWREKRGLSQRALAEAADISVSYLAEIESKKKPGSADALQRVSTLLEVPMETLSEDHGQPAEPGFQPVSRSQVAAEKLAKLAEGGASRERMAHEARAIVSEWLRAADRQGVRHQLRATVAALRHSLAGLSAGWVAAVAANQDRIGKTGAADRLRRVSEATEAALDALKTEYRKL